MAELGGLIVFGGGSVVGTYDRLRPRNPVDDFPLPPEGCGGLAGGAGRCILGGRP